ncbi:alpha-L-glutamate ligase RimK family [Roseburia sp. CAG:309]|nr:alpha-L-glutamate ligase RimK family [Roseburia sp. CAG:309]
MYGWIIVNGFLYTSKFSELTDLFMEAAKEHNIDLFVKTNSECFLGMFELSTEKKPDFVLFWDKDILLAKYFATCGIPVYNPAEGIEICDDKRKTALALSMHGLPQPLTFPAPMTYENIGFPQLDFLSQIQSKLHFPIIVKEAFGSFGQQVYLAKDHKELCALTKKLETVPFLYQQFIRESSGRDIRLQVVGDEVVAAMERTSETDFRANISNGGTMKAYQPDQEAVTLAVKACRAVKCDFAGVDLLFGSDGYLVCEVNSNAHFKNLLDCTGVNTAWYILQYIKKQGEQPHVE